MANTVYMLSYIYHCLALVVAALVQILIAKVPRVLIIDLI